MAEDKNAPADVTKAAATQIEEDIAPEQAARVEAPVDSHATDETGNETDVSETGDDDTAWQNRRLCSDGNCIGVIGTNGCCKECGRPYDGDDTPEEWPVEDDTDDDADWDGSTADDYQGYDDADDVEDDNVEDETRDPDDDWNSRVLCRDGNCIGVIGPDGRCKECGLPYKKSAKD